MYKIGFLLSGSGSTLENLLVYLKENRLENIQVSVVISSRENAYGLTRAKNHKIPAHVVPYKDYKSKPEAYSQKITEFLDQYEVDLAVMGGFMSLYIVPPHYQNRVLNIHPALIPAFCGKGFYGERVHQAVLDYGCKVSGCTVHIVDNEYDHGPIVAQRVVDVYEDDTVESLQHRVGDVEKQIYPWVIRAFAENRVEIQERKVFIKALKKSPGFHTNS